MYSYITPAKPMLLPSSPEKIAPQETKEKKSYDVGKRGDSKEIIFVLPRSHKRTIDWPQRPRTNLTGPFRTILEE